MGLVRLHPRLVEEHPHAQGPVRHLLHVVMRRMAVDETGAGSGLASKCALPSILIDPTSTMHRSRLNSPNATRTHRLRRGYRPDPL